MGDNSAENGTNDKPGSTTGLETRASENAAGEESLTIGEEVLVSDGRGNEDSESEDGSSSTGNDDTAPAEDNKLQPLDALKIFQAAVAKIRDENPVPPYLKEASMLVEYVHELEETVELLRGQLKGSEVDEDASTNSEESDDQADSSPMEHAVYREVKVRTGGHIGRTFFEDKGDDSFSKEYSGSSDNRYPLTRRRVFTKNGLHLKTSLLIQSAVLLDLLKEIIAPSTSKDYARLFAQKVKLPQPYVVLYQNRRRLQEAAAREEDEQKAALLTLLLDFMKQERPETWQKMDELEAGTCTHILFEDAWVLYAPETTIFRKVTKTWEAFKVQHIEASHLPMLDSIRIKGCSLDFDDSGTRLLPVKDRLEIWPYTGYRHIADLEFVPVSHLPDGSNVCDDLRTRGEAFWEFNSHPAYRQYVGTAWPTTLASDSVRVIIDYVSPSRYDNEEDDYDRYDTRSETDDETHDSCAICTWKYARLSSYPPTEVDSTRICTKDRWSKATLQDSDEVNNQGQGKENPLIFCPSWVWAFSLKHKSWRRVEVHKLSPVARAGDPFEKLVMSPQYKLVVESMVEAHLGKSIFSDIVKDKGRGLIVLLHGGPGTGKTLTAECVAEKKMRPLYMVTCGDLGTNPDELEKRLQRTFLYAVNWNAILLLDEADVFLQERDLQDLHRNALVSIFLRHIEYYDGLLFLTTNRPGQIDEAFQSRIHITLGLPDLDFKLQRDIWLIFIKSLRFEGCDKAATKKKKLELLSFVHSELEQRLEKAGYHMNGRQIRNCMSAASAIARKHGRDLQKEDIITVIELGAQFKDYMQRVNRMTQDEKARALGLRLLQKD